MSFLCGYYTVLAAVAKSEAGKRKTPPTGGVFACCLVRERDNESCEDDCRYDCGSSYAADSIAPYLAEAAVFLAVNGLEFVIGATRDNLA